MPVFNPSSNFKLLWDFVILFIVILFLFFIPIHIIFAMPFSDLMGSFLTFSGPALLILDNIIYLNMGIYNKGVLTSNRSEIFKYWLHSMIFVDCVSITPISLMIYLELDLNENYEEFRFFLLLFVFKLQRIRNLIRKL